MVPKSLYFLPEWQKAKRNPNHFWVNTALFVGWFYCPSRCGHNAVCINEDLIIWGGYSEPEVGNATYCEKEALWVYNMDNDFWFSVKTEGEAPQYRSGAVSVLSWPFWYIIGGHTYLGDVNDVYALNLITLRWKQVVPSIPEGLSRRDKAAGWYWQNRIYILGGYGPSPKQDLWEERKDVFTFELSCTSDIARSPGPTAITRYIRDLAVSEVGLLTHRGWNNQMLYLDLQTMNWVRPECEGPTPSSRAAHSVTVVGKKVYIFGGRHRSDRLNDLHCVDLESQKWSGGIMCLGELPCGRSWHIMEKSGNDSNLLLFGGFNNQNIPLEDAWSLNIDSFSWTLLTKQTGFPRLWHSSNVNTHGDILVFGGCVSDITNDSIPMVTGSKVILFKTQPFTLQRLCLHTLYKNKERTQPFWDDLPRDFKEWLHNRCQFYMEMCPDYYENTTVLGFGPSLSSLSIMSQEEATRLNNARVKDESESESSLSSMEENAYDEADFL